VAASVGASRRRYRPNGAPCKGALFLALAVLRPAKDRPEVVAGVPPVLSVSRTPPGDGTGRVPTHRERHDPLGTRARPYSDEEDLRVSADGGRSAAAGRVPSRALALRRASRAVMHADGMACAGNVMTSRVRRMRVSTAVRAERTLDSHATSRRRFFSHKRSWHPESERDRCSWTAAAPATTGSDACPTPALPIP
jgi:hypothetical protein